MTLVHGSAVPTGAEGTPCFKCGTLRLMAAGIGTFCPNRECDAGECVTQEGIDRINAAIAAMRDRFRLKRQIGTMIEKLSGAQLQAVMAAIHKATSTEPGERG